MGKPSSAKPVKLFSGFIFKDEENLKKAEEILIKKFGKADSKSKIMPFDLTDYYREEFGPGLKRVFISFKELINPAYLTRIKRITNNIESRLLLSGSRRVNIDPGYLDLAKVVLASTKDFAHRIYLDKGIFAEITLSFKDSSFVPNQWTYPDYRKEEYIAIFNRIRDLYRSQIK
ncbi:MAG: DUF4416 family protein [Candidatus Omnitrophica bacterium]|nr:DUF4416 family protein [Candidatus Omnitrophota bacterium]